MTKVTVGRWGKSLALRMPLDVVQGSGLVDGEQVEIELKDGDIIVRRSDARVEARAEAFAAVQRIIGNRRGKTRAGITLRELIDEGRR